MLGWLFEGEVSKRVGWVSKTAGFLLFIFCFKKGMADLRCEIFSIFYFALLALPDTHQWHNSDLFTNNLSSYTFEWPNLNSLRKKNWLVQVLGKVFGLASNFKGCESHRGLGAEDLCCCSLKETTHGVGLPTARLAKPGMIVWNIQKNENLTLFIILTASKWYVAFVSSYISYIWSIYIHTFIYSHMIYSKIKLLWILP